MMRNRHLLFTSVPPTTSNIKRIFQVTICAKPVTLIDAPKTDFRRSGVRSKLGVEGKGVGGWIRAWRAIEHNHHPSLVVLPAYYLLGHNTPSRKKSRPLPSPQDISVVQPNLTSVHHLTSPVHPKGQVWNWQLSNFTPLLFPCMKGKTGVNTCMDGNGKWRNWGVISHRDHQFAWRTRSWMRSWIRSLGRLLGLLQFNWWHPYMLLYECQHFESGAMSFTQGKGENVICGC